MTVSVRSAMHKLIHDRLREHFGEPDNSLGRDDHWALKPHGPLNVSINVLVNGSAELPAVWIFDPHSRQEPVFRASIKDEEDLHKLIKQLEHRLERAAAKRI